MENKVKSTLFRFVNLRGPELSDEKKLPRRFVFFPENLHSGSHFYGSAATSDSKWEILKGLLSPFEESNKIYSSDQQIKDELSNIYEFSVWLIRSKSTCTEQELQQKREEVTSSIVSVSKLAKLWDNLFYQVVSQKSFYTKELIMQLLLADHVLKNDIQAITGDSDYLELAHARIVLPQEMFLDDTKSSNVVLGKAKEDNPVLSFPTLEMKKKQEIAFAQINIHKAEPLKKELSRLDKKYHKKCQNSYDEAVKDYQNLIKPLLDKYYKELDVERKKWCTVRDPNVPYNPNDPCHQPDQIPYPELPGFTFGFIPEIDHKVLKSDLTAESFNSLVEFLGLTKEKPTAADYDLIFDGYDTYESLYKVIEDATSSSQKTILDNTELTPVKYKNFGGILIPVSHKAVLPLYTYQLCVKNVGKKSNLDLTVVLPEWSWYITAISYKIHSGGSDYVQTGYEPYHQSGDNYNIFYLTNLFGTGLADNIISDSDYFEATIWLSTGKKIELHITGLALRACVSGQFKIDDGIKEGDFIPNKFGYRKLGIADYKKVEQTVQCYVAGEISQIENVMASEYREKSTRRLRRSEDTLTTSSEMEREQLTDTTSVSRFEMQSEVAKLLSESKDFYGNASFSASYGMGGTDIQIGANAGFASHTTKEESTRQAMTMSQEITERALDRIVTKVKEERVIKIIEEFEENNHHGYDNRGTDQHVSGVYRWVDKLYKNQIINYGKRLMFEFMIPQPAKLHLLGLDQLSNEEFDLITPPDPRKVTNEYFPIKKPSDITLDNANFWAGWYNVEIKVKPESTLHVGKSLASDLTNTVERIEFASVKDEMQIPEGYKATLAKATLAGVDDGDNKNGKGIVASIGNKQIVDTTKGALIRIVGEVAIDNFVGVIPVGVTFANYFSGSVNFSVKCELTTEALAQWQQETFNAIIAAYEDKLAEFIDKKTAFDEAAKNVEETKTNPGFYRKIENMVLRKNCISYMMDRTDGAIYKYGREGMYLYSDFMNLEVNTDAALDTYASFVKFMEQAFEWENISYNFYPFYWGNKYDWKSMYNTTEGDPLFHSFLQSGMARVIAPVRPGFEDAVQFYLATGLIWNGGQVPVIGDPLYMSIADELKEIKGKPEGKAWITRVPTALTILQAGSIGLEVEGALPCNCDDKDEFEDPSQVPCDSGFTKSDSVLGGGTSEGEGAASRSIENIDIKNGYLQLTTDGKPRQVVAQISIEAIKREMDKKPEN